MIMPSRVRCHKIICIWLTVIHNPYSRSYTDNLMTLRQCWSNVGSPSTPLDPHWTSIGLVFFRVCCWAINCHKLNSYPTNTCGVHQMSNTRGPSLSNLNRSTNKHSFFITPAQCADFRWNEIYTVYLISAEITTKCYPYFCHHNYSWKYYYHIIMMNRPNIFSWTIYVSWM